MLPDDVDKAVRGIQARRIKEEGVSYSFSSALSDVLRIGLGNRSLLKKR